MSWNTALQISRAIENPYNADVHFLKNLTVEGNANIGGDITIFKPLTDVLTDGNDADNKSIIGVDSLTMDGTLTIGTSGKIQQNVSSGSQLTQLQALKLIGNTSNSQLQSLKIYNSVPDRALPSAGENKVGVDFFNTITNLGLTGVQNTGRIELKDSNGVVNDFNSMMSFYIATDNSESGGGTGQLTEGLRIMGANGNNVSVGVPGQLLSDSLGVNTFTVDTSGNVHIEGDLTVVGSYPESNETLEQVLTNGNDGGGLDITNVNSITADNININTQLDVNSMFEVDTSGNVVSKGTITTENIYCVNDINVNNNFTVDTSGNVNIEGNLTVSGTYPGGGGSETIEQVLTNGNDAGGLGIDNLDFVDVNNIYFNKISSNEVEIMNSITNTGGGHIECNIPSTNNLIISSDTRLTVDSSLLLPVFNLSLNSIIGFGIGSVLPSQACGIYNYNIYTGGDMQLQLPPLSASFLGGEINIYNNNETTTHQLQIFSNGLIDGKIIYDGGIVDDVVIEGLKHVSFKLIKFTSSDYMWYAK
jgi:hypothetical protein